MKKYDQVINYLFEHLPYYQRTGPAAYKDNLSNTIALDRIYNHPHKNYRTIHVAGTNGKGSVSNMLASILMEAGYKTGLYTSPHLKDFRERIRVNGKMITKNFITRFVNDFVNHHNAEKIEPSFFELTVMMAFEYFAKEKIDVAVIEVGLGGRLDSTNIITPVLSVITNISYDHTAILGDTLGKIALEKAGIIKKKVPVVIGETNVETEVIFKGVAGNMKAPFVFADQKYQADISPTDTVKMRAYTIYKNNSPLFKDLHLDLLGDYQGKNICTLLAAIEELQTAGWKITEQDIREGLSKVVRNTALPGRWQQIGTSPPIICDIAHNPAGIREIVSQISKTPHNKLHIVFGTVNDKDLNSILYLMPPQAKYYFTKADIPRALNEKLLKTQAEKFKLKGSAYSTVKRALDAAKENSAQDDLIMIFGSTFVVAEVIP